PLHRMHDLTDREAALLQVLQHVAPLGDLPRVGQHVVVVNVDQHFENTAGGHLDSRPYRPPGNGAIRPSSSRISNIEAIDSPDKPERATSVSMVAGSKPSASNSISYSLSNGTPPGSAAPRNSSR